LDGIDVPLEHTHRVAAALLDGDIHARRSEQWIAAAPLPEAGRPGGAGRVPGALP
jgi:hypothetical protein